MASEAALSSLRGEGVVEFALYPGGYVRFGDDFVLVATPRSPRGPLTVPFAGLHATPLRPGEGQLGAILTGGGEWASVPHQ